MYILWNLSKNDVIEKKKENTMSAFLGPIHYWLYKKIQLQEEFIQDMIEAAKDKNWDKGLEEEVAKTCGVAERSPLEEVIDEGNIHGWLQYQIQISEARLAFVVTKLLKEDTNRLNTLKEIAFSFGEKHLIAKGTGADEAYKELNNSLLDGMPCDRVNEPLAQDKTKASWRQNECIHESYWNEVDGDVLVYYELRTQIINGMLSGSGLVFEIDDNDIRTIKQEG